MPKISGLNLVVVLNAVALCSCRQNAATALQTPLDQAWISPEAAKDARLVAEPVGKHDVGGAIVTSGKVAFDDLRVAHVFSPVTGRLTEILAQPGQRVKREQALATILSPDMGQVFSDLAKAQAAEIQTRNDWNRQKGLFASHAAAQRDYESAENAYLSAKAELERALRKAHLLSRLGGNRASQEFVIRSPIEGEIIMRAANPGIEVQGTYGGATPVELFTVGERDRVWVLADLYEADEGAMLHPMLQSPRGAEVSNKKARKLFGFRASCFFAGPRRRRRRLRRVVSRRARR